MNIILCGYKSCGKTTIAKAYSQLFTCSFIDTDSLIIEKFQSSHGKDCTIGEIYHELGELEFRQLEADVIRSIDKAENTIIATGGGAVVGISNVEYLKSLGKIIYLQINHNVIYKRLSETDNPPSFIDKNNKAADLKNYLGSRDDIYNRISDYVIDTNHKTIEEIVTIIYQYRCKHGQ